MVNQLRGHQKGPAPRTGRANYTTIEEIPMGEEVLAGTFLLNECPSIILLDSGASHDFASFVTPIFYKNKIFVHIGLHIKMHIKL
jgi:hypothetical protein